jgi:hypothetical protein
MSIEMGLSWKCLGPANPRCLIAYMSWHGKGVRGKTRFWTTNPIRYTDANLFTLLMELRRPA